VYHLKLVADKATESGMYEQKQLPMKAGLAVAEVIEDSGIDEIVGDMFPEISEDVAVRPLLKTEDLMLIRKLFTPNVTS